MSKVQISLCDFLLEALNSIVELYLAYPIKRFIVLNEKAHKKSNEVLRTMLDEHVENFSTLFKPNNIHYFRALTIIPCTTLLMCEFRILPCIILLVLDLVDFLNEFLTTSWEDVNRTDAEGEDPNHEVEPKVISSCITRYRESEYCEFLGSLSKKVLLVTCWIHLLSTIQRTEYSRALQFFVLWILILSEAAHLYLRVRMYYTNNGVLVPTLTRQHGFSSPVKTDSLEETIQRFEMVGGALFVISCFRYFGLLLLIAVLPLVYESFRRKLKKCVIYVDGTTSKFDHETLKFWKQAKGLGSKLIVGITVDSPDMIMNANSCESVDYVLKSAPKRLSLKYLKELDVDYVACGVNQGVGAVNTELTTAGCCLLILDDKSAIIMESKIVKSE